MPKPKRFYASMKQAAALLNIPYRVFQKAKVHPQCAHCFNPQNGKIDWLLLEPLFRQHHDDLWEGLENTANVEEWELRKKKAAALMAEIELERLRERILYKEDVEQALSAIVNSQRALLRSKAVVDLPQHLVGLTVQEITVKMEELVNSIVLLMKKMKYDTGTPTNQ